MPETYIDLERSFLDVTEKDEAFSDSYRYISELTGKKTTWNDLIANRYVVVLGEAGSGKTVEFTEQCKRLRSEGHQTFFCRIESLAGEGLETALESREDIDRFRLWLRNSSEDAFFFIDSLDEGRLKGKSFEDALRKLRQALTEEDIKRSRIFISCRVSDWQATADLKAFTDILPIPPKIDCIDSEDEKEDESISPFSSYYEDQETRTSCPSNIGAAEVVFRVRIVQLAPLNEAQIAKLAALHGVENADTLIQAINKADCCHFAERPQDVIWLCDYWKANGQLGRLSQLIEYNIEQKIRETNTSRLSTDKLSREEAWAGSETLAAAATFCRKSFFILPDQPIAAERATTSISPHEILPHLNSEKITSLLDRAVFDEATYGRVRFHHRSVIEYLTARWLKKLVNGGCPLSQILNLLFQKGYGETVSIPSMEPVIAWLSTMSEDICRMTQKIAPEILIQYGDPQQLPLEARSEILLKFANKYADRRRTGFSFDAASLRRFVHSDLSDTILYALDKYRKETDYRELLLRLIAQGRLGACAETAMAIALGADEEEEIRLYAIDAISAAGTDDQLTKVTGYAVKQAKELSPRLLGTFCEELFPKGMSVKQLITVLRSALQITPDDYRGLPDVLSRIAEKTCPQDKLLQFISELLKLTKKKPYLKEHEVSKRYVWLAQPIAKALTRILKEFPTEQIPVAIVIDALSMIKTGKRLYGDYHEDNGDLKTAISKHPPLIREIFWETARRKRIPKGNGPPPVVNQLYQIHHSETLWDLSAADLDWLVDDLANRGELDDRLLALHGIFQIFFVTGQRDEIVPRIRAAALGNKELENQLNEYLIPRSKKKTDFERRHRAEENKRKRKEETRHQKNKEVLLLDINQIRDGKNFSALHFLRYEMREKGSRNSWGQASWRSLIPKYGTEVAEAARAGFKRMWRDWSPPLPHETSSRKEIENGIPVGLTGLDLDAADGLDFQSLSTDELNKATRYAMRELNGFPEWLNKLAEFFPVAVRSTIAKCVKADYAIASDQECPHDVLAKLVYAATGLINLCAPDVFVLIKKGTPPNSGNLDYVLRILLKSSAINSNEFAAIAAKRTRSAIRERRLFLPWFETWLITSGEEAVIFLEKHLSSLPSRDADELMLNLCSALVSRHGFTSEANKTNYENVTTLTRFIPLIYEHIRPEDDAVHYGAHSLNERDHAEEYRSKVSTKLSEISGIDTYKALITLANDPRISHHKDYFLMLARRRAALDAEFNAWQSGDVNRFGIHFGVEPKTAEDLFEIALERLDDIRNHIEKSDFSTRGLFRSDTPEEEIQKWFADRLRLTSRSYYSVHREEEVDRRKKPDIRLSNPNTEGPVGIEVKCADSWTYRQLENALKLQLAGQYLRDIKSRHGILLLAYIGCKKRWKTLDRKGWLKFRNVAASLEKEADAFARNNGGISQLKVVAIDFSPA